MSGLPGLSRGGEARSLARGRGQRRDHPTAYIRKLRAHSPAWAWPIAIAVGLAGAVDAIAEPFGPGQATVEVQLGVGSALGLYGLALDADLPSHLSVWAGAGGSMMADDTQVGAGLRGRLYIDHLYSLGIGSGVSYGGVVFIPIEGSFTWAPSPWAVAEGLADRRFDSGMRAGFSVGSSSHFGAGGCVGYTSGAPPDLCTSPVQFTPVRRRRVRLGLVDVVDTAGVPLRPPTCVAQRD